jgi:hypothetical protein
MRQFHVTFPIRHALRDKLGWTHYRLILKVMNETARNFYMDECVNYYTREMMNEGDNPPIGIILCADKSDAIVRYTLAENNRQIFASKYMLYLPTEEELRAEIETQKRMFYLQQAEKGGKGE